MGHALESMIVFPAQAYGPWALLMAIVVFLYWLTFTQGGRSTVHAIVDVAYVSTVIAGIWIAMIATLAWVFSASFSIASLIVH